MDLSVRLLDGLVLQNPVLSASGTYGAGLEGARFGELSGLGGLVTKTVTPRPRAGNPPPRLAETASGMLNSIGLENPGVDRYLEEDFPRALQLGIPILLNVAGESFEEYESVTERVQDSGATALEINLSCPNVQGGALPFSTDVHECERVVAAVRRKSRLPIFVKLSPNVTRITELAQAAEAGGADGLTLINTLIGLSIDARARRTRLALGIGGLSGPAIKPVALRIVWQVRKVTSLPILGVGGAESAEDVLEFLLAGANAVQIGTAQFRDPLAAVHVARDLEVWLREEGRTLDEYQTGLEEPIGR